MKRTSLPACVGAALIFLCAGTSSAQDVVFNGDFQTASYTPMWTLTGGNANTLIAVFETKLNEKSLCLKRRPGTPDDNGGFEQEVHLFAGVAYQFHAYIAAQETG